MSDPGDGLNLYGGVGPGFCSCGRPRMCGPLPERDEVGTISIRCKSCHERALRACGLLDVALTEHFGQRVSANCGTEDIVCKTIDERPCETHEDLTPRVHVTEDDLSC